MRFSLIDGIEEIVPDQSISAIKNLSRAEEYLADHFPGFPVMPGVMMLEALVQASAWLMRISTDFEYSTTLLNETKALRFKSFVAPGHKLQIKSNVFKTNDAIWTFKASGTVDGQEVVSARLLLKHFNLADQNDQWRDIDQRMIAHHKTIWNEMQLLSARDHGANASE